MDRNSSQASNRYTLGRSLSARRAWIEIARLGGAPQRGCVALRKESVDRNVAIGHVYKPGLVSLSARRAWIEMGM